MPDQNPVLPQPILPPSKQLLRKRNVFDSWSVNYGAVDNVLKYAELTHTPHKTFYAFWSHGIFGPRETHLEVRVTEKAIGKVNYKFTEKEQASKVFRRSLFVVEDIKEGENFTQTNVRSIRPGYGLPPKHICSILWKAAKTNIDAGRPLSWEHVC